MLMERIEHPFAPVWSVESRVLILGTMASPASRQNGFYYGHPQNRFWRALADVYGAPVPEGVEARAAFALDHGIALWDVLKSCDITGASDASIRNPVPNDIAGLLKKAPIARILTTGKTAARLYRRLLQPAIGLPAVTLPSPSPANCRMPYPVLVAAYRAALLPATPESET